MIFVGSKLGVFNIVQKILHLNNINKILFYTKIHYDKIYEIKVVNLLITIENYVGLLNVV